MTFLGLNWVDALVVLAYIAGVLVIGEYMARKVKSGNDFFLAGRKLGKFFQFFLNFGNMTGDPSYATLTAASVYQEGIGGIWLGLISLFTTPYYWFMNPWFRRVRLTTIAELFEDRFGKRFLATLFALAGVLLSPLGMGLSNLVALKTLQPVMAKPVSAYTSADQRTVADYREFVHLRQEVAEGTLPPSETPRYEALKDQDAQGQLQSYISYLHPVAFYLSSGALVCVFVMLGGLKASAVVDAVQSGLIIIISVILIPFGLARTGGWHGLHQRVPDYMFHVFGSASTSEYTWYSIAAFILVNYVSITAAPANMTISGSARDEMAARLGAIGGGFAKRFVTIAWGLCGLIALAIFGKGLIDPDQTWGLLSRALLPAGILGVMLVGLLGGKLASLGAYSIVLSAWAVKNMYEPLFPGKSEKHYMVVARLTVPVLLALGVLVALYMKSAISLGKSFAAMGVIWGAPILLIFLWRRLTETAVRVQTVSCLLLLGILPFVVPTIPPLRQAERLTAMTREKIVDQRRIEPVALFFDEGLARTDPADPHSPRQGSGRFNVEIFLISLAGFDVAGLTPPQLLALRFVVDGTLPFILLIGVSLLTAPTDPLRVARFYARMKTPVGPTPQADAAAVAASYADPTRFEHTKLFPRSDWEFTRWDRTDAFGFLACCVTVGVILLFFKAAVMLGS